MPIDPSIEERTTTTIFLLLRSHTHTRSNLYPNLHFRRCNETPSRSNLWWMGHFTFLFLFSPPTHFLVVSSQRLSSFTLIRSGHPRHTRQHHQLHHAHAPMNTHTLTDYVCVYAPYSSSPHYNSRITISNSALSNLRLRVNIHMLRGLLTRVCAFNWIWLVIVLFSFLYTFQKNFDFFHSFAWATFVKSN